MNLQIPSNPPEAGTWPALPDEQRRVLLTDLCKLENADLSMLGLPETGPVWVLDMGDGIQVGAEQELLLLALAQMGLKVSPVQALADGWTVYLEQDGDEPCVVVQEQLPENAELARNVFLRSVAGQSSVMTLADWAAVQASAVALQALDNSPAAAPPIPRLAPFVQKELRILRWLPVAAGQPDKPQKLRRAAAMLSLEQPKGLSNLKQVGTQDSGFCLQVCQDEQGSWANIHDLLRALRIGLDTADLQPWPPHDANRHLLHQTLRAAMRERGFVELIDRPTHVRLDRDETDGGSVVAPPEVDVALQVVLALGLAWPAISEEAAWERPQKRVPMALAGRLWVQERTEREKRNAKRLAQTEAPSFKTIRRSGKPRSAPVREVGHVAMSL